MKKQRRKEEAILFATGLFLCLSWGSLGSLGKKEIEAFNHNVINQNSKTQTPVKGLLLHRG